MASFAWTLEQFKAIERQAADDGLSFGEATRLLAGARITGDAGVQIETDWSQVAGGSSMPAVRDI